MPVAALNVQSRIYIVEKNYQDSSNYNVFMKLILSRPEHTIHKENQSSRDEYETLLHHVAQTESERNILKHTLCSSHNLSRRKASKLYGICHKDCQRNRKEEYGFS